MSEILRAATSKIELANLKEFEDRHGEFEQLAADYLKTLKQLQEERRIREVLEQP